MNSEPNYDDSKFVEWINQPAYPLVSVEQPYYPGMSRLEYFVAKAMSAGLQGIWNSLVNSPYNIDPTAREAIKIMAQEAFDHLAEPTLITVKHQLYLIWKELK